MAGHIDIEPEYEAMLRSVGIQPGWRVLAAGCETGGYVPLLCELVGPCGWITVRDASRAHMADMQARLYEDPPPCRVDTELGPLDAMPQPAQAYDAIWCADVSRHLGDADLHRTLVEFVRVLRPGGLLAIEDIDLTSMRSSVFESASLWQELSSIESRVAWIHGALRTARLDRELETLGLRDVHQSTTLVTRHAPLDPAGRTYIRSTLAALAEAIESAGQVGHAPWWRQFRDPRSCDQALSRPDFDWQERHVMAIGRAVHGGH